MDTTIFLMILFAVCCVWFWIPEITFTYHYCRYRTEDFVKYLRFKLKNMKRE